MAGAGYKLFTTGSVLTAADVNTYLAEQTVMVFANAAARTTALSGVVSEGMISYLKDTNAVEVYDGSNWVSSDDPNAIQNTIVDAKGDLITATANDVPARLAVGNNGETLVADSSATTGLRWTATPSASNPVLNSAMDIWQRGTSFVPTSSGVYTADRWQSYRATSGSTVSRQAAQNSDLPFVQYCMRVQRDSGNTGTGEIYLAQSFESTNAIPYAGKTVTFSWYARRGANFSATSNAQSFRVKTGTGTDQNGLLTTYTGETTPINTSVTLTTTWARYSVTATLDNNITEFCPLFFYAPTGTAGANDYFDFTGFQIDIGSVALPYRRNSATLAGERSACERYYWRTTADVQYLGVGTAKSTTVADFVIEYPTTMRTAPTLSANSGTTYFGFDSAAVLTGDSTIGNFYSPSTKRVLARITTTGLTTGQGGIGQTRNTAAYVEASAEL